MNPAGIIVKKRCEWNRYCSHVAPFYSERLIEIGISRPMITGRCYHCEGFVCNRCASHRPIENGAGTAIFDAWELLCPLDGRPLGRGDDWIVFSSTAETACRSAGPPGPALLTEIFIRGIVWRDNSPEAAAVLQLLTEAFQALAAEQYQNALEIGSKILGVSPDHANAMLVHRRALEKLRRFDEAWETMKTFLQADQESLKRGIGELNALAAVDSQTRAYIIGEILAALKTAVPAAKEKLVRDTISKFREII